MTLINLEWDNVDDEKINWYKEPNDRNWKYNLLVVKLRTVQLYQRFSLNKII